MENNLTDIIERIIADLKEEVEKGILNESDNNQKLNDQFIEALDDSSSSCDSTSSDDEEKSKRTNKILIKKKFDEDASEDDEEDNTKIRNQKYLKTKDELTIDDLEPVEIVDIYIEPSVKLEKIGRVISKVDNKLVVIQSVREDPLKDPPTLDEETYLFDSNRKSVGKIFETFGPVASPFYVIRFNNLNEITDRNLNLELDSYVYFAKSNQYTKFVFNIDQLRKQKGSDASWSNDNEPPVECLDYSDDEQEKVAKKQLKGSKPKINSNYSDSESEESTEKKSPNKNSKKPANTGFAQKRKYDQRQVKNFSNGQSFDQQQQPQPMIPYFYPGQMYAPHAYPFYPNPQMINYHYPHQMYPAQGFNYYQQQNSNMSPNFTQRNQQNYDNKIQKNNANIVKKSF